MKCTFENITQYDRPWENWTINENLEAEYLKDREYGTDDSQFWGCDGPGHPGELVELFSPDDLAEHLQTEPAYAKTS